MNKLEKILITIRLIGITTPLVIENKTYTIGAMTTSSAVALTLLMKQRYDMHTYNPFKDIKK